MMALRIQFWSWVFKVSFGETSILLLRERCQKKAPNQITSTWITTKRLTSAKHDRRRAPVLDMWAKNESNVPEVFDATYRLQIP